jgi:capsid protein
MLTKKESSFDQRLFDRIKVGTFGGIPGVTAYSGSYRTIGSIAYNGEKTYGEVGPIKDYFLDYEALRARSWQMFLESEAAQIILKNHIEWVIGTGLKLQSEPVKDVIEAEGISIDTQKFSKSIEAQFRLYSKSRMSDYSDMSNLNMIQSEAYKNAKVGGDVLVILRFDGEVRVQLIDGVHVQSPIYGSEFFPLELANGNRIVNGIELDSKGQHVAYYVRKDYRTLEYERIAARGTDTNALMAYMVYGSKYRLDNHRGMPLLSVLFETAKKLERYKDATLGSAEERQKIAYTVEHDVYSTGENPLARHTVVARDVEMNRRDGYVPVDDLGNKIADRIAVSTQKQVFNLPLGAHMKAVESKNELYFKDFYTTNLMLFCAAAGIPYEVAMQKYDSNYSASRGAMKAWEHKLAVERYNFGFQFMQPIYDFFLEVRAFQRRIKGGYIGYIRARMSGDRVLLEAYRNARFVGPPVPHIDPEKEVKAERLKLGTAGAHIPLTTVERATENLGGGDSYSNIEQFAEELTISESKGIKVPEIQKEKEKAKNKPKPTAKPAVKKKKPSKI